MFGRAAICRIRSAFPPTLYTQEHIKNELVHFMEKVHPSSPHIQFTKQIFENSLIHTKNMLYDPASIHDCKNSNSTMATAHCFAFAAKLCDNLVTNLLEDARLSLRQIDAAFIGTEVCPGTALENFLFINNPISNPHMKCETVTGKGCVGGITILRKQLDYLKAYPEQITLGLNVDLYSRLWWYAYGNVFLEYGSPELYNDPAVKRILRNAFISACILGDAAVGTILVGEKNPLYKRLVDQGAVVLTDSTRVNVPGTVELVCGIARPYGGIPLLSQHISKVGTAAGKESLQMLLNKHPQVDQLSWHVIHPGGSRVLETIIKEMHFTPTQLRHSFEVLRDYGNCSSPTVTLVLERTIANLQNTGKHEYGMIQAPGPGMTSETILAERFCT